MNPSTIAIQSLFLGALAMGASLITLAHAADEPIVTAGVVDAGVLHVNPFASGTKWDGYYRCVQGQTQITLQMTSVMVNHVEAIFEFTIPERNTRGSYRMRGDFDTRSAAIKFVPVEWINQPQGYVMVAMYGKATSESYVGDILFEGCGAFSVSPRR